MSNRTVILEREENLAIITLNRPEALNAIDEKMMVDAPAAIEEVAEDDAIRAVILTGAGNGFCTGADVKKLLEQQMKKPPPPIIETYYGAALRSEHSPLAMMNKMILRIRTMDKPVIAAVNGIALGGGFSIALACDIRIASEKARFSMGFVKMCLCPDTGGSYFLPSLVGTARACELMLTGDIIDAKEADRIGLVNRVVPHEELMKRTKELGVKIAEHSPLAIKSNKQALYHGNLEPDLANQLEYEFHINGFLTQTEDFEEAVRSFLEKRKPLFKGR